MVLVKISDHLTTKTLKFCPGHGQGQLFVISIAAVMWAVEIYKMASSVP